MLVKATRAAGGDAATALVNFRKHHAAELSAQESSEADRMDARSAERELMRQRAGDRTQRIHEIQAELKAGKDPSEIVPPE
jgi:hypothetical protein